MKKSLKMKDYPVTGVAWFDNKIYVVARHSRTVHVFPDEELSQGESVEYIELEDMEDPRDIIASSQSIFISDYNRKVLWEIQMPGRKISSREIDGEPCEISINSSDELTVCVTGRLNLYRSSDMMMLKSVLLPKDIDTMMNNAVQLLDGNFLIAHSTKDQPDSFCISELSADGKTIIPKFDPRTIETIGVRYWTPEYISIDEDANIFIADVDNNRIVVLNSRWNDFQILLNKDQHHIELPRRLCYVQRKQELIVGQYRKPGSSTPDALVFKLGQHTPSPNNRALESELFLMKQQFFELEIFNKVGHSSLPTLGM